MDVDAEFGRISRLQNELEETYVRLSQSEGWLMFFARPHVDGHIRRSLGRLRNIYVQMYQVLDASEHRPWFSEIAASLVDFEKTFPTRSKLLPLRDASVSLKEFAGLPGIAAILGVSWVASLLHKPLEYCDCHTISWGALAIVLWTILCLVSGFLTKRRKFMAEEAYAKEAELFEVLGHERPIEIQTDPIGWILVALVYLIAGKLLLELDPPTDPQRVRWGAAIAAAISVGALVQTFWRPWAWNKHGPSTTETGAPAD